MHILIVEDEIQLADALSEILKRNKYFVDTVYDGNDGLDSALTGIYDCILLDIMLPGGGYIFNFDKVPLTLGDVNLDNYAALAAYLRDNAKFDNPGQEFGKKINCEHFAIDPEIEKPLTCDVNNAREILSSYIIMCFKSSMFLSSLNIFWVITRTAL